MRDLLSWNLNIGAVAGVRVRIHVLFLLLAVFVVHAAADLPANSGQAAWPWWYALAVLVIWLASVLLHEMAHCVVAVRLGGEAHQVVLWPLGGLAPALAPPEPRAELLVALAGPAINLLLALATLPPLLMMLNAPVSDVFSILPPSSAQSNDAFSLQVCLQLVFWLNSALVLVNLLPATPLDGGRLVRSMFCSTFGLHSAVLLSARVAQASAIALWLAAFLLHGSVYSFAWGPLVLLGVVLFFCARQEAAAVEQTRLAQELGIDLTAERSPGSRGTDSATKLRPNPVTRWLEERREARQQQQQRIEAEEELRVDDILARLHEKGPQGISSEDRALLDRVSARYRSRLNK